MLSIIIPIYNAEKYLRRCLDSVVKLQTFEDYELICVDDGSTDGSSKILQDYKSNPHVSVLHQKNQGAGVARNNGIAHAKGDYIMFLDSDDTMVCGENTRMAYDYVRNNNIDVLLCERNEMDEDGTYLRSFHPHTELLPSGVTQIFHPKDAGLSLFRIVYNGPCAKLFRREIIVKKDVKYPSLRRSEDFIFVHLCMDYAERLATFDVQLFNHRRNVATSLEANKDKTPLIFLEANEYYYAELYRRGLEDFIPPAKIHSIGFILYNLKMMNTYEGYKVIFDKLAEYYSLYKLDVPLNDSMYEYYTKVSRTIEEMIGYGDAGNYLFYQLKKSQKTIDAQKNTIVCLQNDIDSLRNRRIVNLCNKITSVFRRCCF